MRDKNIEELKIKRLKSLSIDEKIKILGSMLDTFMKIKVELVKERYNITDEDALSLIRKKLSELESNGVDGIEL